MFVPPENGSNQLPFCGQSPPNKPGGAHHSHKLSIRSNCSLGKKTANGGSPQLQKNPSEAINSAFPRYSPPSKKSNRSLGSTTQLSGPQLWSNQKETQAVPRLTPLIKDLSSLVPGFCVNHPEKKSKYFLKESVDVSGASVPNVGLCSVCAVKMAQLSFEVFEVLPEEERLRKDEIDSFGVRLKEVKESCDRLDSAISKNLEIVLEHFAREEESIGVVFEKCHQIFERKKEEAIRSLLQRKKQSRELLLAAQNRNMGHLAEMNHVQKDIAENYDSIIKKMESGPLQEILEKLKEKLEGIASSVQLTQSSNVDVGFGFSQSEKEAEKFMAEFEKAFSLFLTSSSRKIPFYVISLNGQIALKPNQLLPQEIKPSHDSRNYYSLSQNGQNSLSNNSISVKSNDLAKNESVYVSFGDSKIDYESAKSTEHFSSPSLAFGTQNQNTECLMVTSNNRTQDNPYVGNVSNSLHNSVGTLGTRQFVSEDFNGSSDQVVQSPRFQLDPLQTESIEENQQQPENNFTKPTHANDFSRQNTCGYSPSSFTRQNKTAPNSSTNSFGWEGTPSPKGIQEKFGSTISSHEQSCQLSHNNSTGRVSGHSRNNSVQKCKTLLDKVAENQAKQMVFYNSMVKQNPSLHTETLEDEDEEEAKRNKKEINFMIIEAENEEGSALPTPDISKEKDKLPESLVEYFKALQNKKCQKEKELRNKEILE